MFRNIIFIIICIAIIALGIDIFSPNTQENISIHDFFTQEERVEQNSKNEENKSIQKPVLIYFYADWCGGCRQFSPYWNRIVSEYSEKYSCLKINIDDDKHKKLTRGFNIRGIPQIYIYDRTRQKKIPLKVTTYMNPQLDEYYKKYYEK